MPKTEPADPDLLNTAIAICPEYYFSKMPTTSECCWAIMSAYQGTEAANRSAHRFIKHLGWKLGMSVEQIYEAWQELEEAHEPTA